ncbi:glycosyltransferase [Bacillus cereus]
MSSSNVEVSVIIPVRNEEEFIEACLNSVLANEYPKDNMEIIIIDGNSEDLTIKLVREYQQKFNNIKLFMNPQKIAPVAMNIGIKMLRENILSDLMHMLRMINTIFKIV